MSSEIQNKLNKCDEAITDAIATPEIQMWRLGRSLRNQASKLIERIKNKYFTSIFNNTKTIWKSIKLVTNKNTATLPRRINVEGKSITSSKAIENECILFFKNKMDLIHAKFRDSDLNPLLFLEFLLLEVKMALKIPMISVDKTLKII